jgi:hypothetical protein
VVEKEARQAAYRLHCSNHFKKADWGHSAIFKMALEDFSVLLAPSDSMLPLEVFDRKYLVEYPSREIWLSEAEVWLPSDGLKFYTDSSLFEGRAGSGDFIIMACSDYCLRECMTGKTICICSDIRAALLALSLHTVSKDW